MDLTVIAPWSLNPSSPYTKLSLDYASRMKSPFHFKFITPSKSFKYSHESQTFLKKSLSQWAESKGQLVVCDPTGQSLSSEAFASWVDKHKVMGTKSLGFLIGGPEGIPSGLIAGTSHPLSHKPFVLSLSQFTFVHELAMVILLEQIFRSQCILNHHPYHRGNPSGFSSKNL